MSLTIRKIKIFRAINCFIFFFQKFVDLLISHCHLLVCRLQKKTDPRSCIWYEFQKTKITKSNTEILEIKLFFFSVNRHFSFNIYICKITKTHPYCLITLYSCNAKMSQRIKCSFYNEIAFTVNKIHRQDSILILKFIILKDYDKFLNANLILSLFGWKTNLPFHNVSKYLEQSISMY